MLLKEVAKQLSFTAAPLAVEADIEFVDFWLQWNAATECNVMLPLAAWPLRSE